MKRSSKMNHTINKDTHQVICILLFNFLALASAYEYPIALQKSPTWTQEYDNNNHQSKLKNKALFSGPMQSNVLTKKGGFVSSVVDRRSNQDAVENLLRSQQIDNDEQQLRHFHQVVDTVRQLLNEEDQQLRQSQQIASQFHPQVTSLHGDSGDLFSEIAIRKAIEELEKTQAQQERKSASSTQSNIESSPTTSSNLMTSSNINNERYSSSPQPTANMVTSPAAAASSSSSYEQASQFNPANINLLNLGHDLSTQGSSLQFSQLSLQGNHNKPDTLDSLLDELSEEIMSDQLSSASQDTTRLSVPEAQQILEHQRTATASHRKPKNYNSEQIVTNTTVPSSTTTMTSSTHNSPAFMDSRSSLVPMMVSTTSPITTTRASISTTTSTTTTKRDDDNAKSQSAFISGQLDSLNSELGEALTSDFYAFHEGATSGPDDTSHLNYQTPKPASLQTPSEEGSSKFPTTEFKTGSSINNDLESAAQTRNFVANRENQFQQPAHVRFDFNQPIVPNFQQSPRELQHQARPQSQNPSFHHDNLIRTLRQEPGNNNNSPPPFSTIMPFQSSDNLWRPTINFNPGNVQNNNNLPDLNQQYFSNVRDNQQNLANLPQSRFQSLPPSNPFSQSSPSTRQAQHIHYTGHSLVASNEFPSLQVASSSDGRSFVSTSSPIISVVSGGTSNGGSVSWNPPPSLQAPSIQSQSTFSPQMNDQNNNNLNNGHFQQAFAPTNRGPQNVQSRASPSSLLQQEPPSNSRTHGQFRKDTTIDTTTESKLLTSTTPRWSQPPPSTSVSTERDVADSQPRSSFKPSTNHMRSNGDLYDQTTTTTAFSNEDLDEHSVTPSSKLTTTTSTLPISESTIPLASSSQTPTNSSKKEDTVIYYYYYYDDNKNATIVAKNISNTQSASPSSLDAAIEADSGVEDTPFMDDPIPFIDHRNQAPKMAQPPSSTTSSTTTSTSTTTTTTSSTPLIRDETRSRNHGNLIQKQHALSHDIAGSRLPNQDKNFVTPKPNNLHPSRNVHEVTSPASVRANARGQANSDIHSRFKSTEQPSISSTIGSSTRSSELNFTPTTRKPIQTTDHHQLIASSVSTNKKIQNDLINSILSGFPSGPKPFQSRQQNGPSSHSRTSSSNASRYGINNNGAVDPFGLDSTNPVQIPSSTLSSPHHPKVHQHNSISSVSHQTGRKPGSANQSTISDTHNHVINNNPNAVGFSSQRNQPDHLASKPTSIPRNIQSSISSIHHRNQQVNKPNFPELTNDSGINESNHIDTNRVSTPTSRSSLHDSRVSSTPKPIINDDSDSQNIRDAITPDSIRFQSNNNVRTPEPELVSTSSRAPNQQSNATPSFNNIQDKPTSTTPFSTHSSTATSVTRSFINPQNVQVTTSMSPPIVVSKSIIATVTRSSIDSSSTSTIAPVSSTTPAPEIITSTESFDSNSSTRKKFGNRNNRFQTRINSIHRTSSTSTTTTTPLPQSSTTKRPIISTTRKSSKQLFPGRSKLGHFDSSSDITNSSSTNIHSQENGSNENSEGQTSKVPSRSRFGINSTSSRLRTISSTSTTNVSSNSTSSPVNVSKPSMKQKIPSFNLTKLNLTNQTNDQLVSGSLEPLVSTDEANLKPNTSQTLNMQKVPVANEKNLTNTENLPEVLESAKQPINEIEMLDQKEVPSSIKPIEIVSIAPPTTSPAPEQSSRNKPRVRPLFASRNRNSTLFGNRRSNTTTSSK